jgi:RNA polymerase sigma-70 factor (ECF subfamily)
MVARIVPSSSPRPATVDQVARTALSRLEAQHDAVLVQRFIAGDESAYVEIVGRYHTKMLHVAFRLLRNRADAEEIAQDTFIRAHRSLAHFRGDSSLAAWLYCITLNLARNRYWYFFRRRRHAMLPFDTALGANNPATLADLVACDDPGPVREVVNNEFADNVTRCTEQLPPGQREILRLRNVQHHSYAHISRVLGIGLGTAKSRIARARRSLRGLLGKVYPEFKADTSPIASFEPIRSVHRSEIACA